jgi:hypothetical protein
MQTHRATIGGVSARPDYKNNPLWNEAIALARDAYAIASELAPRDPDEARLLRRVAVTVPARLAGALEADRLEARAAETFEARAALDEVAAVAERVPTRGNSGRALARRARALEGSVRRSFGQSGGRVC